VNTTLKASYSILTRTRGIGPNQAEPAFTSFARELGAMRPGAAVFDAETILGSGSLPPALQSAETIVAVLEDYTLPGTSFDKESQSKVLDRLRPLGARVVLAALCDPYVLRGREEFAAAVCSCSSRSCGAAAAARVITGAASFRGRLPVTIERS
jgi:beta-N-acetylhexosaminidase